MNRRHFIGSLLALPALREVNPTPITAQSICAYYAVPVRVLGELPNQTYAPEVIAPLETLNRYRKL